MLTTRRFLPRPNTPGSPVMESERFPVDPAEDGRMMLAAQTINKLLQQLLQRAPGEEITVCYYNIRHEESNPDCKLGWFRMIDGKLWKEFQERMEVEHPAQ